MRELWISIKLFIRLRGPGCSGLELVVRSCWVGEARVVQEAQFVGLAGGLVGFAAPEPMVDIEGE